MKAEGAGGGVDRIQLELLGRAALGAITVLAELVIRNQRRQEQPLAIEIELNIVDTIV